VRNRSLFDKEMTRRAKILDYEITLLGLFGNRGTALDGNPCHYNTCPTDAQGALPSGDVLHLFHLGALQLPEGIMEEFQK
jgi:hypothetical protein